MKKIAAGFVKSILAGLAVSLGGYVFLSCENKYVGSVLFSVGLLTVVYLGLNLYTGRIGYIFSQNCEERIDTLFSLPGNVLGCLCAGLLKPPVGQVESLVASKLTKPLSGVFTDGILCGILIFICVDIFKRKQNPIAILFCVPAFILCGFEHSVADAFYIANARAFSLESLWFFLVVAAGNAVGGVLIPLLLNPSFKTVKKLETE